MGDVGGMELDGPISCAMPWSSRGQWFARNMLEETKTFDLATIFRCVLLLCVAVCALQFNVAWGKQASLLLPQLSQKARVIRSSLVIMFWLCVSESWELPFLRGAASSLSELDLTHGLRDAFVGICLLDLIVSLLQPTRVEDFCSLFDVLFGLKNGGIWEENFLELLPAAVAAPHFNSLGIMCGLFAICTFSSKHILEGKRNIPEALLLWYDEFEAQVLEPIQGITPTNFFFSEVALFALKTYSGVDSALASISDSFAALGTRIHIFD